MDRSNESVAAAGESFDETGIGGGVSEGVAEFADSSVEAFFEINEGWAPELFAELFPGHDLARAFGQEDEKAEGLLLDADFSPGFAKFPGRRISFKDSETNRVGQRPRLYLRIRGLQRPA